MANNINTIIATYIGDGESALQLKRQIDSMSKQGYTIRRIYISGTKIKIEPFLKKVVKESLDKESLEILESLNLEAPNFLKITEAGIITSDDPSKRVASFEAPHLTKSLNSIFKAPMSNYLTDALNTEVTQIFVDGNTGKISLYSGSLGDNYVGDIQETYKVSEEWFNDTKKAEEEAAKWQKIETEIEKVTVEDLRHIANFITDHFKRKADRFIADSNAKKSIGNIALALSKYKIIESRILQHKLEEKKVEFPTKGAGIELTLTCTGTMTQEQSDKIFANIAKAFNNKSFEVRDHIVKYAFNLPNTITSKLASDGKSATMEFPVNVSIIRNLTKEQARSYEAYTRLGQGEKPDFTSPAPQNNASNASVAPQTTSNTTSATKRAGGSGNAVTKALSKTAELGAQAATSVVKTAVKAPFAVAKGLAKGVAKGVASGSKKGWEKATSPASKWGL